MIIKYLGVALKMCSEEKAKVLSFINMKGGVGKTTLLFEFAHYIDNKLKKKDGSKFKILLIDTDPQSNLTQNERERLGGHQEGDAFVEQEGDPIFGNKSIQRLFDSDELAPKVHIDNAIFSLNEQIDLLPGELQAIFLERTQVGNGGVLRDFVLDNNLLDVYDLILIDCPPTYSLYTELSLLVSDFYIVPVTPDSYATLGIELLEEVVKRIMNSHRNDIFKDKKLKRLGIVINRYVNDKDAEGWKKAIKKLYPNEIYPDEIASRKKLGAYDLGKAAVDTQAHQVILQIKKFSETTLQRMSIDYIQEGSGQ